MFKARQVLQIDFPSSWISNFIHACDIFYSGHVIYSINYSDKEHNALYLFFSYLVRKEWSYEQKSKKLDEVHERWTHIYVCYAYLHMPILLSKFLPISVSA
jgi:hypothetical protein